MTKPLDLDDIEIFCRRVPSHAYTYVPTLVARVRELEEKVKWLEAARDLLLAKPAGREGEG